MFNKEMLLNGVKKSEYAVVEDGKLKKAPYWNNIGGCYVEISNIQLEPDRWNPWTIVRASSNGKFNSSSSIKMLCRENRVVCDLSFNDGVYLKSGIVYSNMDDIFDLVGTTRTFEFTPPPDGYLDLAADKPI